MKKILFSSMLLVSFLSPVFAATDDTQIIDKLNTMKAPDTMQFELKKFQSCQEMEEVMNKFMEPYYKYRPMYRGYDDMLGGAIMDGDIAMEKSAIDSPQASSSSNGGGTDDFSKTNVQVAGVDESDIIKTDGEYIYYISDYYDNNTNRQVKNVYIAKAYPADKMEVVKKILLPENFYASDLYVADNKLTIIATGYSNVDYSYYWVNRNTKTFVMTYDVTSKTQLKLEKLYIVDGSYSKSRRVGDNLYVISQNYLNFPYYAYREGGTVPEFDIAKSMPKEINISPSTGENDKKLQIKGKTFPYIVSGGAVADCSDIEYILPDEDTMEKYSFNPTYNIISTINLKDSSKKVENKIIFGNTSEIYMSLDNLYLTSHIYTPTSYYCPFNARCIMPWYPQGENTLIHKLSVDGMEMNYEASNMVPGNPLTQYSMDEKDGNFRIITSRWYPERQTDLYILDKDLKKVSSLEGLGKGENFQASRYIGDKLFLVTFEQIDPLFAIDLADQKNPKILGELKIPGYSTYLHPYDAKHIIGLGYDTEVNQWGGTSTSGLKLDLYEINYDKKCGDSGLTTEEKAGCDKGDYKGIIVKQKYTLTLGDNGSYSEVLNNPRAFVWNEAKKLLLLPATLFTADKNDMYKYTDFFQGLVAIGVDANIGIKEKARISHIDTTGIEEKRTEECKQYTAPDTSEKCRVLIDGSTYCAPTSNYYYIPEYCYKDSTIGEYLAAQNWNYSSYFVKRALYIGQNIYSISDKKIKASDINDFSQKGVLELK